MIRGERAHRPHRVGVLEGQRPRHAGSNARLGDHGLTVRVPLARLTTDDGAQGFGAFRGSRDDAAALLGTPLSEAFAWKAARRTAARVWDYPALGPDGEAGRACPSTRWPRR